MEFVMPYIKNQLIEDFRNNAENIVGPLQVSPSCQSDKAKVINTRIKSFREKLLTDLKIRAANENWPNYMLLEDVLLLNYASYIAMLEYRNRVWPYEYMAFARRIGEFWEPFCKLAFEYPLKPLSIINPPDFGTVQHSIMQRSSSYIDSLVELDNYKKEELKQNYSIPWTMVDSGGIDLALDLHFEQNGIHYNCDFKSGFSSNEKGNANRLLLVASIYKLLGNQEKTLLFVRQKEDENNHYLQTLKNSPYWDVYCSDDCYAAINLFTGFDIRSWLDRNVDWVNDISYELRTHLYNNDLLKYLTW